jgi:hypothetical protein
MKLSSCMINIKATRKLLSCSSNKYRKSNPLWS